MNHQDTSATYLALGDSYTIGEQVPLTQNFPYQFAAVLRAANYRLADPFIIAKTGWTTDELVTAFEPLLVDKQFDWVSLLIGVNNQYRGRSTKEYYAHFQYLCSRAMHFAGNNAERVLVLSIPDWGLTPFNTSRSQQETSAQIDEYNAINKSLSQQYGFHYIDITASTRAHAQDTAFLAEDLLHPSAKEYAIWAQAMAEYVLNLTQLSK